MGGFFNSLTNAKFKLESEEFDWCNALPLVVSEPLSLQKTHPFIFLVRLSPESSNPYLVMWPCGFPHGAHVERTKIRYTIQIPVDYSHNVNKEAIKRVKNRLLALYDPNQYFDKKHTIPDSGGLIHKHPELMFKYYEEFESFRLLYPSTKFEMEKYLTKIFT